MLNKDAKPLIEAIKDSEYDLNSWETEFMGSIEEQIDKGRNLTQKQGDVLQKIYRHSQGGGFYAGRLRPKKERR